MAKVTAKLTQLSMAKLPYISFLTDPTTGGVTALLQCLVILILPNQEH